MYLKRFLYETFHCRHMLAVLGAIAAAYTVLLLPCRLVKRFRASAADVNSETRTVEGFLCVPGLGFVQEMYCTEYPATLKRVR